MTAQHSVYSTMSTDVNYTFYSKPDETSGVVTATNMIVIAGKANVADKRFITPRGAVTPLSDESLAMLMGNPVFMQHLKNGFVAVEKRGADIDKVVSDLVPRDESAPLEPGDFEEGAAPVASTAVEQDTAPPAPLAATKRANTSRATTKK